MNEVKALSRIFDKIHSTSDTNRQKLLDYTDELVKQIAKDRLFLGCIPVLWIALTMFRIGFASSHLNYERTSKVYKDWLEIYENTRKDENRIHDEIEKHKWKVSFKLACSYDKEEVWE